jgi:GNAT superfamily N-acetyltransferase
MTDSPSASPDPIGLAPAVVISDVTRPDQLDAVRGLIRAFVAWHRARHVEDLRLIDGYFDSEAFEAELAGLPGKYARPGGRLLLATVAGRPAGCVALRSLGEGVCEMKRMFVDPELQGRGVGKALGGRLIEEARLAGYRTMRLDTSIRQLEAIGLYERLGFRRIQPYYPLAEELANWLVFMELTIQVDR